MHNKLTEAAAKQYDLQVEAVDRAETLKRKRTPPPPYPSEWVTEHEEEAIKKLHVEVRDMGFSIAGMKAMFKATTVNNEMRRGG